MKPFQVPLAPAGEKGVWLEDHERELARYQAAIRTVVERARAECQDMGGVCYCEDKGPCDWCPKRLIAELLPLVEGEDDLS